MNVPETPPQDSVQVRPEVGPAKVDRFTVPPEEKETRKKSLKYSIIDGCAASMMTGFGENWIVPFATDILKSSNILIGFLSSIPQLFGTAAQLISVNILDRTGKRKALIMPGIVLQMLSWLPIFFLPFIWPEQGPVLLIAAFIVAVSSVNFAVPAWNSLMGDLVEPDKRGRYIGKRNALGQVFALGSVYASGFILDYFKPIDPWMGFGIVFGVAFLARAVSAFYMNKMIEPNYVMTGKDRFTFWDFIRRSPKSNFGRFVLYSALVNMAVSISGPFFTIYYYKDLGFSNRQFASFIVVNTLSSVLMMRFWGRLADKFGNKKILAVTGLLVPIVPVLWLISPNYYAILGFQIFGGAVWAGFSLATGNFIFDAVSPGKRARCVAYYSLLSNIGVFLGATLGGWLSTYLPKDFSLVGLSIVLVSPLQLLFVLSGVLRLIFALIFLPRIKEVRQVQPIETWELLFQITQIRPILGPIFEIFSGGDKKDKMNNRG